MPDVVVRRAITLEPARELAVGVLLAQGVDLFRFRRVHGEFQPQVVRGLEIDRQAVTVVGDAMLDFAASRRRTISS